MLETADDLASRLVEMRLHRLPDDHLAGWTGALGRVTRADLLRAAREHLDPERLAIVVVGKADEVSAPLRELAPLEIVDVDGRPRP